MLNDTFAFRRHLQNKNMLLFSVLSFLMLLLHTVVALDIGCYVPTKIVKVSGNAVQAYYCSLNENAPRRLYWSIKSSDANTFRVQVFNESQYNAYVGGATATCINDYCAISTTSADSYVDIDFRGSVYLVIYCIKGSLFNMNCDLSINMDMQATTSGRFAVYGECMTSAYCKACPNPSSNSINGYGTCCADCATTSLPSISNGICSNTCLAFDPHAVTPTTYSSAAPVSSGSTCDCACRQRQCVTACLPRDVSINTCSETNGVVTSESCDCSPRPAPTSPTPPTGGCDCGCVQRRCLASCMPMSAIVNTCNSLNDVVTDHLCTCGSTAVNNNGGGGGGMGALLLFSLCILVALVD